VVTVIVKAGSITALILFVVLFIKFLVQLRGSHLNPSQKGQEFVQILIISIIVLIIAVPEGLPLAVTLALAYATTRMVKDNNLVRVFKACETMGNATTVCSDKTGTLTQNEMTVVVATLGVSDRLGVWQTDKGNELNGETSLARLTQLPATMKILIRQSIVVNSTAFEGQTVRGANTFIGSKTETALLEMAREYLDVKDLSERDDVTVVHHIPFSSERKCMGVVVHQVKTSVYRLFIKGASEIILARCKRVLRVATPEPLSEENSASLSNTIDVYASRSLRTIAMAYRDLPQWPQSEEISFDELFQDLTWIGVFGIKDPLRPGVLKAVRDCQNAGVMVRLVTGDNLTTAKSIARECGILSGDGIAMEGPEFRNLTSEQMAEKIGRLQVLARSSPIDKYSLVKYLKESGETVAVTGDGTNDGPALTVADVGFSMGLSGTEVAKEASDIVLVDDNFESIVKAIMWGRSIGDAVKKFLQVWTPGNYADPVSIDCQRERSFVDMYFCNC
jgi:P-type Ca2+ transporter type 2C